MTTIAAVQCEGRIAIAADTRVNWGGEVYPPSNHKARKLFQWCGAWFGFSGSGPLDSLLRRYLAGGLDRKMGDAFPAAVVWGTADADTVAGLFESFFRAVRKSGYLCADQPSEAGHVFPNLEGEWLVASPAGIFFVGSDLTVAHLLRYGAIGSGGEAARGCLEGVLDWDASAGRKATDAQTLARHAVEVASRFDVYTGGPIVSEVVEALVPPATFTDCVIYRDGKLERIADVTTGEPLPVKVSGEVTLGVGHAELKEAPTCARCGGELQPGLFFYQGDRRLCLSCSENPAQGDPIESVTVYDGPAGGKGRKVALRELRCAKCSGEFAPDQALCGHKGGWWHASCVVEDQRPDDEEGRRYAAGKGWVRDLAGELETWRRNGRIVSREVVAGYGWRWRVRKHAGVVWSLREAIDRAEAVPARGAAERNPDPVVHRTEIEAKCPGCGKTPNPETCDECYARSRGWERSRLRDWCYVNDGFPEIWCRSGPNGSKWLFLADDLEEVPSPSLREAVERLSVHPPIPQSDKRKGWRLEPGGYGFLELVHESGARIYERGGFFMRMLPGSRERRAFDPAVGETLLGSQQRIELTARKEAAINEEADT